MEFKRIKKGKSVVQMAVDQILTRIIAGNMKPGDLLPLEAKLADSFGIGKSTTREALRILESRGVIEVVPRKHILVKMIPEELLAEGRVDFELNLGPGHLPELLDGLVPILASCAYLACRNRTPKDLDDLSAELAEIENCLVMLEQTGSGRKIQKTYETRYMAFYACMARATHNLLFQKFMETLFSNIRLHLPMAEIFFIHDIRDARMLLALDREIFSAIDSRDCTQSMALGLKKAREITRILSEALKV